MTRRPELGWGLCAALFTVASSASAAIRYVKADAAGAATGANWTDAHSTLSAALSGASAGDEIWVAAGTYRPGPPGSARSVTFAVVPGVSVLGGFPGLPAQEGDASVRNASQYLTILSGDLAGDDLPNFANRSDNVYHVLTTTGATTDTVLDGFTVRGGQADGINNDENGGGVRVASGTILIRNCVFRDNQATTAGAIWGAATANQCLFTNNVATSAGAVRSITATDCHFIRNRAEFGGAGSSGSFTRCRFIENAALSGGALTYGTVTRCLFERNRATGGSKDHGGGALSGPSVVSKCVFRENASASGGGAIYIPSQQFVTVSNCLFVKNEAAEGGAVYTFDGNPSFRYCTFISNSAYRVGGGLHDAAYSSLVVECCILWNNRAPAGAQMSAVVSLSTNWQLKDILVEGGITGMYFGQPYPFNTFTNIRDVDPLLALDGSGRLMPGSPCIDGNTSSQPSGGTDLDDLPRRVDGDGDGVAINDIGAYEFQPNAPAMDASPGSFLISVFEGEPAPLRTLQLRSCGSGALDVTLTATTPWIIAPSSSLGLSEKPSSIDVQFDTAALPYGEHEGEIVLTPSQSGARVIRIPVRARIKRIFRVPAEYPTIQEGIDATHVPGDLVLLADGTYSGAGNRAVTFRGKNIVVRSEHGYANCIINGSGRNSGFIFNSFETEESVLEGVTLRSVNALMGAGVRCDYSSPTIRNCCFHQCYAGQKGSGLYGYDSNPVIVGCLFQANQPATGLLGGGVALESSGGRIFNSRFLDLSATMGGGVGCQNSQPLIVNCLFARNAASEGGALYAGLIYLNYPERYVADVCNSTIMDNMAPVGPGMRSSTYLRTSNCLIWRNGTGWKQVDAVGSGRILLNYNSINSNGNLQNYASVASIGPGNIMTAPILGFEYYTTAASPGVDAGDNAALPYDLADLDNDGDRFEPLPVDLAGQPRRQDSPGTPDTGNGPFPIVNMGAYEQTIEAPPQIVSAVSLKTHANVVYGLPVRVVGPPWTNEPRQGGATHVRLTFQTPIIPLPAEQGGLQVTCSPGQVVDVIFQGVDLTLVLNVMDRTCSTITIDGIQTSTGGVLSAPIRFNVRHVFGDVSQDGQTNLGDALSSKSLFGHPLNSNLCAYDVNLSGQINIGDVIAIRNAVSSLPVVTCP